jgi:3-oxoacyl-(acyl-carrier-protein) synthase
MAARGRDDERRVVVTGMGIVTTIGETLAEYRDSLVAGRSGITRWKQVDGRIYSKIGGDLSDFDHKAHLARVGTHYPADLVQQALKLLRVTPLSGRATAMAALQAFVDAGLPDSAFNPERFGHILAGHNLNAAYIHENAVTVEDEPEYIDSLYAVVSLDTDVLSVASEILHLQGPSFTMGGACASGNLALLCGLDLLRSGRADKMLVTGGFAALDSVMLQAYALVDAISFRSFNEEPGRASRPWDVRREGFVPSEGAGAVILETAAGARARGARIYAELLGGGYASDASRLPKPNAGGQARAMRLALEDARVNPEDVNYINAHATSTVSGDSVEVEAIKAVFGEHAYRMPVNATKSMTGHCLTAAGVVELVATVLQMQHGFVHPTINLDEPESGLDLDFVPHESRSYRVEIAVSNSFGFGGLNTAIVLDRMR